MNRAAALALLVLGLCSCRNSAEDSADYAADRSLVVLHCRDSSDVILRDPVTGRLILHRVVAVDRYLAPGVLAKDACP